MMIDTTQMIISTIIPTIKPTDEKGYTVSADIATTSELFWSI